MREGIRVYTVGERARRRRSATCARGPRRLVVDGYYGKRNAGDDAFCVVADEVARSRWGCEKLMFVASEAALPNLQTPFRGVFPDPPRFRGHGRLRPLLAMVHARRVVHVGGSTFTHALGRHRDVVRLARLGLLAPHAIGISVGPFATQRDAEETLAVLRRFQTVSVRDSASLERIREIDPSFPVTLGFDVAVLLPVVLGSDGHRQTEPLAAGRPMVGVSVCRNDAIRGGEPTADAERHEALCGTLEQVVRRTGASVRLLVFNDHPYWGDMDLSEDMARRLDGLAPVEVVTRSSAPEVLLDAVASCDVVVGTRLHSCVFAYACNVPFAVVAYHQKCADFAAEVRLTDELLFPKDGPDIADGTDALVAAIETGKSGALLDVGIARQRAWQAFPEAI